MTHVKPEPLNLQFVRITPNWAKPQRARRTLAITMYAMLFVSEILFLQDYLALQFLAGLGMVITMTSFGWLIGATNARADMPNEFLDERERSTRDQTYRFAFINVMGVIALGFLSSSLTPWLNNFSAPELIVLLFFVGALMPTAVQAWVEPDPVLED
jgi:uncharacterized membrane protein YbjE (DUF340 family)